MDIDDDEKDSWFSYLGENKFQFKLFNDCLITLIVAICLVTGIVVAVNFFDGYHPYAIKQTNVVATLNSDGSADLTQMFRYRGSLKHGPVVKIEAPHQIKLKSFKIFRDGKSDQIKRVKYFNLFGNGGNQYTVTRDDDDDWPILTVKAYDPLKHFSHYTVVVRVHEAHVVNRKGVVKWNVIGSSSDVNLGKVTAKVVNHNANVKNYYLQSNHGVLDYGQFNHPATAKIHHFTRSDHLDLRTNMPVRGPLKITRILNQIPLVLVGSVVLMGIGYLVITKINGVGVSFALPDEVIDDPFAATLKTPCASTDTSVFSGLVAKLYLEGHITNDDGLSWDGKSNRKLNDDEQELLKLFFDEKDEENNIWISSDEVNYNNKLAKKITRLNQSFRSIWHRILGAIGLFSMIGLGVLVAIMLFADIYIDTDLVTDQDLYRIILLSVAMVIGNWLAIYGLTVVPDADAIPLVQFANGITELDTIKSLQLDNSYLWEDMVYWLVGIGVSDEIVNELVALGVDQGYISSDKSVSELTGGLSSISAVLSDVSAPSGAVDGGSFGGGDAGSGGGAGGW